MPLEDLTGVKFVGHLVPTNPDGGDDISQGDDHIRGVKNVIQQQFGTATNGDVTLPNDLTINGDLTVLGSSPGLDTYRNLIVNGSARVAQRGVSVSVSGTMYSLDRWQYRSAGGSPGRADISQILHTAVPGPKTSATALELDVTTADTAIDTLDHYELIQYIEAFNTDALRLGTGQAATVTVSFWCSATLAGVNSFCFQNADADRNYIAEYTVAGGDAWEFHSITIPLDTAGVWHSNDNAVGLACIWSLATGATFQGTVGSWQPGGQFGSANQVNNFATIGNAFRLTEIQVEIGSVPSAFEVLDYGAELRRCQRYFQRETYEDSSAQRVGFGGMASTTIFRSEWRYPVRLRAVPTVTVSDVTGFDARLNLISENPSGVAFSSVGVHICNMDWTIVAQVQSQWGELTRNGTQPCYMQADAEF